MTNVDKAGRMMAMHYYLAINEVLEDNNIFC